MNYTPSRRYGGPAADVSSSHYGGPHSVGKANVLKGYGGAAAFGYVEPKHTDSILFVRRDLER